MMRLSSRLVALRSLVIDVGEDYNPKWSSPLGTRKYNKDAFIVIENRTRSPFEPSQPNPELKQKHPYGTQSD
jgi:hypothetical protein